MIDNVCENSASKTIAGPDPPLYYNSSWRLISQGAEARVWYVPSFVSIDDDDDSITAAVCKERFPKAYRHIELDVSICKSRTKAEVRSMVKCRRGGVLTPMVYSVLMPSTASRSSCIFMEYIDGCTVRQFFEETLRNSHTINKNGNHSNDSNEEPKCKSTIDSSDDDDDEAATKKPRLLEDKTSTAKSNSIDKQCMLVSREIGLFVAKMHNLNVVHGDLTTSNILLRNKPTNMSFDNNDDWKPKLVMIDFGLASNTAGTGKRGGNVSGHEDKAVDLYVLERAFEATHPGSEDFVKEILRAYKGTCKMSDSVLQRLSQVRLRGRKREAFG